MTAEPTRRPKMLCTIGPATLNRRCLVRMERDGVSLFRINLSHTRLEDLPNVIRQIQRCADVPICIDTEGAQLRTGYLKGGSRKLPAGSLVVIRSQAGASATNGTALGRLSAEIGIALNHPEVLRDIQPGEMIYLDFGATSVQVIEKLETGELLCRVVIGGTIGSNKAANVRAPIQLPALTRKDLGAIPIALDHGIRHFALSFAQSADDVGWMRREIGDDAFLISKVESNRGLQNLEEIIRASDAILIDRGDLSREQAISRIPFWQKRISNAVKAGGKELYVATNLLESMITHKAPTRAEVNDIANTLLDGADGLVLAAETAIGRNPLASVHILKSVIDEYERFRRTGGPHLEDEDSHLIEPHGGTLTLAPRRPRETDGPPPADALTLHHHQYLDFLQLAHGAFSPLRGFQTAAELE
ncbi:MAG TPA: pyruvate kinase, partial [bacterium]|nr:pyruvate kinase [bacterium]